ncbi:MAG TPA: MCE family protein [Actinomycetota bacterium]|nr:MCE family protein [Actinomycetota bacterium]
MRRFRPSLMVKLLLPCALLATSCTALGLGGDCNGTEVIGIFEQVGDLPVAANVQSSDVEIGTIQEIELDEWSAKLTMCLKEGENVPADTLAVIRTTSLLGEKFVDLQPQSDSPPYLQDGDVLDLDVTSKATELEDIFAKLAGILGAGNLEQINRFTAAQAKILRGHTGDVKDLLSKLNTFTGLLAERKEKVSSAVDSLDSVARTLKSDSATLTNFLRSFADSSEVLANNKEGLQSLLISLDRFSNVSAQLLIQTERGLNSQFKDLKPILKTLVSDTGRIHETLQTLATFSEYFPETMPGSYLQLDVCQAVPENYEQGLTCPQSIENDDPKVAPLSQEEPKAENAAEYILRLPLVGVRNDSR